MQNIVSYKNIEFFFAFCSSQFTTKNHEQRKGAWGEQEIHGMMMKMMTDDIFTLQMPTQMFLSLAPGYALHFCDLSTVKSNTKQNIFAHKGQLFLR